MFTDSSGIYTLLFLFFLDKVKKSMEIVNNGPDVKNECGEAGSADE